VKSPVVITGTAYGRRATIEIAGDTLTWRAQRGFSPVPENIVTTVHDVRLASWLVTRHSWAGVAIGVLGGVWLATEGPALGISAIAIGIGLLAWRFMHPRQFLVLDIKDNRLVMRVSLASAGSARALADRIDHALETGEVPSSPPMLP